MGRKSQQEILRLYLLHRECVRRNSRYKRAYRTIQAITDPERHAAEMVALNQCWGLSPDEDPPDPNDWPKADPEALLRSVGATRAKINSHMAQFDPVELDAALHGMDMLRADLSGLAQQLNGFLLLLHLPERPSPPWGVAAIDLRRPKEEILEAVRVLLDEVGKSGPQPRQERGPMRGPLKKGFDYLRVYDLREKEQKRLKEIVDLMWADSQQVTEQKAGVYFAKAKKMINQPPLLRALTTQLKQRRCGRAHYWEDVLESPPSAWAKHVWLRPLRLSNGQWM